MPNFVDAIKRPLSIPLRFVAYSEKHKIYELFQELAKQLIIDKPDDHILYMKQCLEHAIRKRDIPRIILIAPPTFELGLRPVTLQHLRDKNVTNKNCLCNEAGDLAMNMRKLLKSGLLHDSGWILVDTPRSKREARAFQRLGIIPTHVLQIIISSELDRKQTTETIPNYYLGINDMDDDVDNEEMQTYTKNLRGLREVYANHLVEVETGIRSIEDLAKDCVALMKMKKPCGAPSLFRIVLIGSRGSGCRTVAKYLVNRFNLVHVDFNYILEQAHLQLTPLGEILRLFEQRWEEPPKPEIRIQVVDKYINTPECLNRGWVLTGYPITVEDLKLLDTIDMPPNKVIFVQVSVETRKERLLNRRYNTVTGSKHDLTSSENYKKKSAGKLSIHPKDYVNVVNEEIQRFDNNVEEMLKYAGETAFIIDGNGDEISVRENVEGCLMQSWMYGKPREPRPPPVIDPCDVEFNPDDEPDISIFDEIMPPEFRYTFT
ncbi:hypothetical protein KPH14_006567 [Odynerus spinipes]|uniref:Adenylate kinase 8 n=1 Tax=Odynerus spinipes TaxID=1348599 RepID=A0AAD9VS71_9HYME|nr:hypothetical protein KPH14_006567 [Odynerus spinipes]